MLSVHRARLVAAGRAAAGGGGGGGGGGGDDVHVCYAVAASVLSLVLVCGILTVVPSPRAYALTKAYAVLFAAAVMLVLILIGWLVAPRLGGALAADPGPPRDDGDGAAGAPATAAAAAAPVRLARRLCACGLAEAAASAGALPAFAYQAHQAPGDTGGDEPLCAVCLEDVRAGEMVRQLPPCRHLFHVACVDVWLRSHRTCPLCRCELPPRKATAAAAAAGPRRFVIPAAADALPLPPV